MYKIYNLQVDAISFLYVLKLQNMLKTASEKMINSLELNNT